MNRIDLKRDLENIYRAIIYDNQRLDAIISFIKATYEVYMRKNVIKILEDYCYCQGSNVPCTSCRAKADVMRYFDENNH